jgi:hypothetical protein
MTKRITIIQGHPDTPDGHLCHALANAYLMAALEAEFGVRVIEVANLNFPLIRSKTQWEDSALPQT